MPILDFKEIPEAHIASGRQDTFELFCQEFLKGIGLEIESYPDRGPDGGKDLICIERIQGKFSTKSFRWLVSCKHKAHSNSSVSVSDELNISDRMIEHEADGFIAFYSTVPSSSLNNRLNSYKEKFEVKVFNAEEIEYILLGSKQGKTIISRFFPVSHKKLQQKHVPSNIYTKYEPLKCHCCGRDLLIKDKKAGGIIAFVYDPIFNEENSYIREKYVDIYFACKGSCDNILSYKYSKKGLYTYWKDVSDLKIPMLYIEWVISIMNNLYNESIIFEKVAFEKIKEVILIIAQDVFRHQSEKEIDRIESLLDIPEWV